jgi:glycerophosphoryl diester phosphodiesterase
MSKPNVLKTHFLTAVAALFGVLSLASTLSNAADAAPQAPLVIGHRGLGQKHAPEPENSLLALETAFKKGVNAVEFDVQLSNDGEVVLAHDPRLERMTDGHGCLSRFDLSQLRTFKLKDETGFVHEDLPMSTLAEALERIRQYDTPDRPFLADIHIKVYDFLRGDMVGVDNGGCPRTRYAQLTRSVLDIVRAAGLLDRVIFTAFDHRVLDLIKSELPHERVGLLTAIAPAHALAAARGKYEYVALDKDHFHAWHVAMAHKLGLGVLIWSPAGEKELRSEAAEGVDAWITDNVPESVSIRSELLAR